MPKEQRSLFDQPGVQRQNSGSGEDLVSLLSSNYEVELLRFLEDEYGKLETNDKLAVIFTSLFMKAGHTCVPENRPISDLGKLLDLDDSLFNRLPDQVLRTATSVIAGPPDSEKPLVSVQNKLYLSRFHKMEIEVKNWIEHKSGGEEEPLNPEHRTVLESLFPYQNHEIDWQKAAVALSLFKNFLIISGGPGTGKTTTVARLLVMHQRISKQDLKIGLAAPTGKAAGRMGEALKNELSKMDLSDSERQRYPSEAGTIHRLLRGVEERGLLPPVRRKKLQYDLIVIDEASMIDLSLMYRLLKHLKPATKLILLGDKDQLASVEAGSVFADLCKKTENGFLPETIDKLNELGIGVKCERKEIKFSDDSILYLTKSYRFDENSGIGTLAEKVKAGFSNSNDLKILTARFNDLNAFPFSYRSEDFNRLMSQITGRVKEASIIRDADELLKFWKSMIWLTVVRRGLSGSDRLNRLAEQSIATKRVVKMRKEWYTGRPIIVNKNDYDLGIFNGDFGVCIESEEEGSYWVYIQSGAGIKKIRPERLQHVSPAYFLTVHKSQGSEFDHVNLLMPVNDVPVLTKELLYTAITRARKYFELHGNFSLFARASQRKTVRFSGI